ncbi:MAG TPA: hypothetical protein VLL54_01395 [Pyrinomonadaceae bacterium]|nr:hypothetical protein [Pyrinomonadaceae bacterium]
MKTKLASLILVILLAVSLGDSCLIVEAQQYNHSKVQPQSATLLSQIAHKDFTTANFNFLLGVRGDSTSPATRNIYDLRFGGYGYDGDSNWLDVEIANGSRSKILDLGPLAWSDVVDVPILYASVVPYDGRRTDKYSKGQRILSLPENTLVKAVVGHLYVLHTKTNERDLYAMFRVESLQPGDEVTISWKLVPSPETKLAGQSQP